MWCDSITVLCLFSFHTGSSAKISVTAVIMIILAILFTLGAGCVLTIKYTPCGKSKPRRKKRRKVQSSMISDEASVANKKPAGHVSYSINDSHSNHLAKYSAHPSNVVASVTNSVSVAPGSAPLFDTRSSHKSKFSSRPPSLETIDEAYWQCQHIDNRTPGYLGAWVHWTILAVKCYGEQMPGHSSTCGELENRYCVAQTCTV